jgi:hypothetical protein
MLYRTARPMVVEAVRIEEALDVETPDGHVHVEPGEWLVRGDNDALFTCDPAYFARTFERLESPKSLSDLDEGKPCGC